MIESHIPSPTSQEPPSGSHRGTGRRDWATAVAVYVLAAIVFTWPLALHPASHLAGPPGPGDSLLNLWILGWGMQAFVGNPMDVLTGRVFNANIFHPAESTLAYSDHMLAQSLLLAPLYALTGDAVLCDNLLLLVSLAASGLAMHAFVRGVTGSTGGAYLAGIAWAFWPYRFAHLPHLQLQALYFLPLAFLCLHRVMAGRRTRDAVLLGVVAGLQALSSVYYAVIGAVGLGVAAVALAVSIGRWRSSVIARRLLLAAVIGGVMIAPVGWMYWNVQRDEGFGRGLYQASRNAASLASYVQVPPENVLYGRTALLAHGVLERALFPGLVVLGLAAVGVIRGRRSDARPLVTTMLAVGGLAFLLSLGPEGFRDPYALFQRYMFGFQAIRAPARFAVLVMFALATLAALGWASLKSLAGRSTGAGRATVNLLAYGLIVVAALEFLNVPLPLGEAPPRRTAVGEWLRREPGPGAVVYLPIGLDVESTPAMVQSLEHRRPLVNGYSGQRPAFYTALVDSLNTFPGDEALLALKEIGARFVVTGAPVAEEPGVPSPLVERARFDEGVVYELRWTPEIESRLAAEAVVTPPSPGPAPFATGETTRYHAMWAGAGMNVVAGEITVAVKEPRYTFAVRVETAPWMARFFDARDTFVTRTDANLLPELHHRDQREGGRHATRAFLYDHDEGVVRMGKSPDAAAGADGVSLPLAAWARDAISAVFYARTLPLDVGERYVLPVNEGGRNMIVELGVTGRETISVQGNSVTAIRVDPRLRQRAARRRAATAALWFSDDPRRVPLAIDVDAPFGRVRLELVSYESP